MTTISSSRFVARPRAAGISTGVGLVCLILRLVGPVDLAAAVFRPDKLAEMDAAITAAVAEKRCPGGVLWVERHGESYHKALGNRAVAPAVEPMTEDTIFDAASLTKVVATTPAIMLLVERGQVDLDAPVATYLPEFRANGKDAVTVRQLMTHTSGLRPGIGRNPDWHGYDKGIELACAEKLVTPPGTVFRYSDINFIVLGEIVHRVSGQLLDVFTSREIFTPLRMVDTGFRPSREKLARIAPTETLASGEVLRGVVHDPTARRMDGVAGHAGLFFTAADVARLAARGDPVAGEAWDQAVWGLAHGVAAVVTALAPERVVLGGGVSRSGEAFARPLRRALAALRADSPLAMSMLPDEKVVVLPGDVNAGAVGAVYLADHNLNHTGTASRR